MVTDVSVGDIEVPFLDVEPGDETTTGVLTVTDPEGEADTPAVAPGTPVGDVVRLTAAAVTYDKPGRWILGWVVTGTGAGAEDLEVNVVPRPTAGGPLWTPGRSRVANYVPARTLSVDAETHEMTFSSTTRPTGVQVDRLIRDAAGWVQLRVGVVDTSLHEQASTVSAIWAAAAVERGWPDDANPTESLRRADQLQQQADRFRDDLARANDAIVGPNPTDPAAALLPVYAFPEPVPWGDEYLL